MRHDEIELPAMNGLDLLRYEVVRAACSAIIRRSRWIATLSNLVLGATAGFAALIVTNVDKLHAYLHSNCPKLTFAFMAISACLGVLIQFFTSWAQMVVGIEKQTRMAVEKAFRKNPDEYGVDLRTVDLIGEVVRPAITDFIRSRPWPFRSMARRGLKRSVTDHAYLFKNAAKNVQLMLLCLIFQYAFFALAVFFPLWKIFR